MLIKVIALKQVLSHTKIFYLNLIEPKNQQLYMAVFEKGFLSTLTIYNTHSNQYEDVTILFPVSFLQNLSEHIHSQIQNEFYREDEGFHKKSIL